ncbi:condensation domain-containing protein, partial [Streptomyces lydicus]|uniref:condensation domain-containing protein n=1 Tax=Streptomyces lydicus TaxID=47763 RepID=UPI003317AB51
MRWELSPNQVDLYTADQAAEDPSTYLVNCVYRITGPADEPLLAERFARLGETYPVLASRVVEDDGAWFLEAAPDPPQLRSVQVADAPDGAAARLRLREELTRPLDLAKGPMCRAVLLRYAPDTADLVLIAHHLVVDGRSMELIARGVLTDETTEPAADWAGWAASARARRRRRGGR